VKPKIEKAKAMKKAHSSSNGYILEYIYIPKIIKSIKHKTEILYFRIMIFYFKSEVLKG